MKTELGGRVPIDVSNPIALKRHKEGIERQCAQRQLEELFLETQLERLSRAWLRQPLDKSCVKRILNEQVERVDFADDLELDHSLGGVLRLKDSNKFLITIRGGQTEDEQAATLIHEIAHIYSEELVGKPVSSWRVQPYTELQLETTKRYEEFIEEKTQEFYRQNPDFVRKLFEMLILERNAMKSVLPWLRERVSLEKL